MNKSTKSNRSLLWWLPKTMIVLVLLLVLSCSMHPAMEEVGGAQSDALAPESSMSGPVYSFPISFHRVDLYMNVSNPVTGTVTVQIRNADGTQIIGSTIVAANDLLKGSFVRNTFRFSPALTLNSGEKYRIYLTRSSAHTQTDNIYWRFSTAADAYPNGVPSVYPGWSGDFAFATYSDGYLDQRQTSGGYGFAISPAYFRWQEFVPQYIWVVAQ